MPPTIKPSKRNARRKKKIQPRNVYQGKPLTVTSQEQMNEEAAMTPERIRKVRAALIPELRELLDAKVVK